MVSLNFDNVRCGDGLLAWPSLADNSGSLLVGGVIHAFVAIQANHVGFMIGGVKT